MYDPRDPRIIKAEAADKIAALLASHGIPAFYGRKVMVMNIIAMFEADWDDLRQAAHQLHAAIEAEGRKLADPGNTHGTGSGDPGVWMPGSGGNAGSSGGHTNDPVLVTEKRLREVVGELNNRLATLDKIAGVHAARYHALAEEVESGRLGLVYRLDTLERVILERLDGLDEAQAKTAARFKRLAEGD